MEEKHLPHHHEEEGKLESLRQCLQKVDNFQTVADVFRQLSDSSRIRIFWLLCHCEECVVNISAMMEMTSPAVSHHLRQLKASGLIVSRRDGKEVYYKAADSEQARLLHVMIEKTIEISCPQDEENELTADAPVRLDLDALAESNAGEYPAEQMETIRRIHDLLTEDLSSRITIDELSRRFHMNPSSMKALFKAVYGQSIAAHIREHRMEKAAALLRETDASMGEIARAVGYESQSKFTAEFRKTFETLPTEYRRAAKKESPCARQGREEAR